MPEAKLDDVVANLKAGDLKNLDEAIASLTLIRNAAHQAGKHILAKSIQQSITAVARSIKIHLDAAANKEEQETMAEITTMVNGRDNNNNNNTNNTTNNPLRNMSQSSKVLAP